MLETGLLTRQINENIITFYIILTGADQTAYLHTVQPGWFSTVGSFSTVDPVVGRICLQCKY